MIIGRVANLTAAAQRPRRPASTATAASRLPVRRLFQQQSARRCPPPTPPGKLTLRPFSIVTELIYDKRQQARHRRAHRRRGDRSRPPSITRGSSSSARSALASTFILLNSTPTVPDGLGNDSGELGHNLMDHHFSVGARRTVEGFDDRYYYGQRPNGIYIPRFRNLRSASKRDYIRGFGYQGGASRENWARASRSSSFGADLKDDADRAGAWRFGIGSSGECCRTTRTG